VPLNMRLRMQHRSVTIDKMAGIFTKRIWQPYSHYCQHSRVGIKCLDNCQFESFLCCIWIIFWCSLFTQDCMPKFSDPLWWTFRKADKLQL